MNLHIDLIRTVPVSRDLLGLLRDSIAEIAHVLLDEVVGAREDTVHTLDLRPGVLPDGRGLIQHVAPDVIGEVRHNRSQHDTLVLAEAKKEVLLHAAAHLVADITVAIADTLHLVITIFKFKFKFKPDLQSVTEAHLLISLVAADHAVSHLVNEHLILQVTAGDRSYEEVVLLFLLLHSGKLAGDDGADEVLLGGERKNGGVGGGHGEVGVIQARVKPSVSTYLSPASAQAKRVASAPNC